MVNRKQIILILVLASAAIYLQTCPFGMAQLDDPHHIFENPDFNPPKLASVVRFWIEPFFSLYIPTTYTFWSAAAAISLSPHWFHFLNFLVHTLNGLLAFELLCLISGNSIASLGGALIFQWHPLQVEAVAWISCMKDLLSTFFLFAAFLSHLNKKETSYRIQKAELFFLLALTSKPAVVVAPALLVLLTRLHLKISWKEALKRSVVWWLLAIPVFLVTKYLQSDSLIQDITPVWTRPLIALDSIGFYLFKILLPRSLLIDYGRSPSHLASLHFVSPLIGLALFFGILGWRIRKHRAFSTAFAFFLLSLLPTSGLIAFQYQLFSTVADRYAYLSLWGISLAITLSWQNWPRSGKVFGGMILLVLAFLSFEQCQIWKDDKSLFENTLKSNPNSFLAHNNYAFYLFFAGRPDKAAHHFNQVVALRPTNAGLRINLASALEKMGKKRESIIEFKRAIALEPNNVAANFHLGRLLLETGDSTGRQYVKQAIALDPNNRAIQNFLANSSG